MKPAKRMLSFFIAAVLAVTSLFLSATQLKVSAASVLKITGTDIWVRTAPGTGADATKIGKTNTPDSYEIKGTTEKDGYTWYNITYNGQNAWVPIADSTWGVVVETTTDPEFEKKIADFPESYKEKLRSLHLSYPNWEFVADKINLSFDYVVRQEELYMRKQVPNTYALSRRTLAQGSYDWNTGVFTDKNGGWVGASREMIAFFMDPRNFLDEDVIMFMQQSYDSATQTADGVKKIIAGTFLEKNYTGGNYVDDIMEAAKQSGVSPYVIAATIITEQGVNGTSSLISGTYSEEYKDCFNFFNVKASGETETDVIVNGLKYAKKHGWNTRRASIIGGAIFYNNGYISVGQDTFYYMDFDVKGGFDHQYAESVRDAYVKTSQAKDAYLSDTSSKLYFKIPVYNDMSDEVSPTPVSVDALNNYYITGMSVSGSASSLTPSFDKFIYDYSLTVSGNAEINLTVPSGASITGAKMSGNDLVLTVKGAAGYSDTYTVGISCTAAANLVIKVGGAAYTTIALNANSSAYVLGDPSLDGKISLVDLSLVKMHILGISGSTLTENAFKAADVNKDGKISIVDLAAIKMHLLGVKYISG